MAAGRYARAMLSEPNVCGLVSGDPRLATITANVHEREAERAVLSNTLVVAEEAGEAVQKIRRYLGLARSSATEDEVAEELADVVISAAVTAGLMGIDITEAVDAKLTKIMDRGGR